MVRPLNIQASLPPLQPLLISICLLFSLLSHSAIADTHALLLQPNMLQNKLTQKQDNLVIVDVRTKKEYLSGHIPDAINLPLIELHRSIDNIKSFVISPLQFQVLVEEIGIQKSDHLVFYAGEQTLDATRAFWVFEFYGHKVNSVLDGGYYHWLKQNYAIEHQPTELSPSQYAIELQSQRFSSKYNTLLATKSDDTLIIDARPQLEYQGVVTMTQRSGHIPTAVNLAWTELVEEHISRPMDDRYSTFISLDNIKKALEHLPDKKEIILYCNGGKEASVLYFSYRLMNQQVSVYDGSWFEWSADPSLEVEANLAYNDELMDF